MPYPNPVVEVAGAGCTGESGLPDANVLQLPRCGPVPPCEAGVGGVQFPVTSGVDAEVTAFSSPEGEVHAEPCNPLQKEPGLLPGERASTVVVGECPTPSVADASALP